MIPSAIPSSPQECDQSAGTPLPAEGHPSPLITVEHLSLGYTDGKDILHDLSFRIHERDFVGIIGPNGGGKTTLVRALLGLLTPRGGTITYHDREGHPTKQMDVGYIPQQNRIDRLFPITVREVVASGLAAGHGRQRTTALQRERIAETIERVGMQDYTDCAIGALSGGQLQRVLLARALVSTPRLIILDEPNTYVDKGFEHRLYELLPELNHEAAIIMVSHDIGTLCKMVRRLFCVNRGLHIHEQPALSCSDCSDANALNYLTLVEHD